MKGWVSEASKDLWVGKGGGLTGGILTAQFSGGGLKRGVGEGCPHSDELKLHWVEVQGPGGG